MKNLVTDKPAPVTTKLAQTEGIPVLVKPVLMKDEMAEHHFGNRIRVGISDVTYAQQEENDEMAVQLEE